MARIRIEINEAEIAAALQVFSERKVVNALRSAVKTTTTWTEKQLESRMAADTGIPIQAFKQYRVHRALLGGYIGGYHGTYIGGPNNDRTEVGYIWEGYNNIAAQFAGKMSQGDTGAWAGQYFFEGAFVAKMKSGHVAIFKRDGRKPFPITEQDIKLVNAEAVASQLAAEANAELLRRFKEKFQV